MADSLSDLPYFLAGLRSVESGGGVAGGFNYTITNRIGAAGGYQMTPAFWTDNGDHRWPNAASAPPAVQDEIAARVATEYFKKYGSWKLVAVAWHGGPGAANRVVADGWGSIAGLNDGDMGTIDYADKVTRLTMENAGRGFYVPAGGPPRSGPAPVAGLPTGGAGRSASVGGQMWTPPWVEGPGGLNANANAAWQFIDHYWDVAGFGGVGERPNNPQSGHPQGRALDVMVTGAGQDPSPEEVANGNSIAFFLTQNPELFGIDYIIWNNMVYDENGFHPYTSSSYNVSDPTGGHRDHLHVEFRDGVSAMGQPGSGWAVAQTDFLAQAAVGGNVAQPHADSVATPVSGGFTGPSGAPGISGEGLPAGASASQVEQFIRENYPQYSGFLDVPEIRTLLITAAQDQWATTKLQAAIQATDWWRTTAPSVREWMGIYATDPAAAGQMLDQRVADLGPLAQQFGITDPAAIATLAEQSIRFGWNDQQIRGNLAYQAQAMSDTEGFSDTSQPDAYADRLMNFARSEYLIPLNRQDVEKWVTQINAGLATEDQFNAYVQQMSQGRFGWLTDGTSPAQYLAPIKNLVAEQLELNPEDIDLLDRRWAPLLEHDSKEGVRPMTFAEAMQWARARPQFRGTETANREAAALGEQLLATFGAV